MNVRQIQVKQAFCLTWQVLLRLELPCLHDETYETEI